MVASCSKSLNVKIVLLYLAFNLLVCVKALPSSLKDVGPPKDTQEKIIISEKANEQEYTIPEETLGQVGNIHEFHSSTEQGRVGQEEELSEEDNANLTRALNIAKKGLRIPKNLLSKLLKN